MPGRPDDLQELLDSVEVVMTGVDGAAAERKLVASVMAACRIRIGKFDDAATGDPTLPVLKSLDVAFVNALAVSPALARVTYALKCLAPQLRWRSRHYNGRGARLNLVEGYASAVIVGRDGYEDRDDLRVGVSLLGSNVSYPDHNHPPEEAYLVLSPGAFRQKQGSWQHRRAGEMFYNTPGIMHGMRSEATPMLALWFLPTA